MFKYSLTFVFVFCVCFFPGAQEYLMHPLAIGPKKEKDSFWGRGGNAIYFRSLILNVATLLSSLILPVCIFELLCVVNRISLQIVMVLFLSGFVHVSSFSCPTSWDFQHSVERKW